jgi:hypothetical protein
MILEVVASMNLQNRNKKRHEHPYMSIVEPCMVNSYYEGDVTLSHPRLSACLHISNSPNDAPWHDLLRFFANIECHCHLE